MSTSTGFSIPLYPLEWTEHADRRMYACGGWRILWRDGSLYYGNIHARLGMRLAGLVLVRHSDRALLRTRIPSAPTATLADSTTINVAGLWPGVAAQFALRREGDPTTEFLKDSYRIQQAVIDAAVADAQAEGLALSDVSLGFAWEIENPEYAYRAQDGAWDDAALQPPDGIDLVYRPGTDKAWDSASPPNTANVRSMYATHNGRKFYVFGVPLHQLDAATAPVMIDPDTGFNPAGTNWGMTPFSMFGEADASKHGFGYWKGSTYQHEFVITDDESTWTGVAEVAAVNPNVPPAIVRTGTDTYYTFGLATLDTVKPHLLTITSWSPTRTATISGKTASGSWPDAASYDIQSLSAVLFPDAGTSGKILVVASGGPSGSDNVYSCLYDINGDSWGSWKTIDSGSRTFFAIALSLSNASGNYCWFPLTYSSGKTDFGKVQMKKYDVSTDTWGSAITIYDDATTHTPGGYTFSVAVNPDDDTEVWVSGAFGKYGAGSNRNRVKWCKTTDGFSTSPTWNGPLAADDDTDYEHYVNTWTYRNGKLYLLVNIYDYNPGVWVAPPSGWQYASGTMTRSDPSTSAKAWNNAMGFVNYQAAQTDTPRAYTTDGAATGDIWYFEGPTDALAEATGLTERGILRGVARGIGRGI